MDLIDISWLQQKMLKIWFWWYWNEYRGKPLYLVAKLYLFISFCYTVMRLSFCSQLFVELKSYISWLQSRYINQIHFRYILLEKLLKLDISTKSIFDISCSSNYSSEIYQPNPFLIYLAQVITRTRYIKQSHFRYILLE